MKVRKGFVSNSSSSSFIVINAENGHEYPKMEGSVLGTIGETEFGWGEYVLDDVWSRINFAWVQAGYLGKMEMLESVIKRCLNMNEIEWALSKEYDEPGKIWAYIDHQSSAAEGENTEMFDSEQMLEDFLFGVGSSIHLDNDNH